MMKRPALLFFLITLVSAGQLAGQQSHNFDPKAAEYIWPTEASPYLTSTFAETRAAHFHAALDIKTWGQRGYEVYATRDGVVDRIAIGPTGYGKVVYLKHPDGSYSVYAHLLSFNNELQQIADSIRFAQDYQFEIDRYLGWKNLKVEQGDVIGYSGASGIGPPHLHFELRTPTDKPFNPLLTNLEVKDDIAPQILGLSIEPRSPKSSIEGANSIYTQRVWGKKNHYEFDTVTVSGPVGLGINAFDKSNRVHNSYAVYELGMQVDGRQLFKSRVDSFSYHETDQMFIDRVYPLLQDEGAGYQRLYTVDGNSLPFYSQEKGVLDLPTGSHEVTITTTDYYGNSTTASVLMNVERTSLPQPSITNDTNEPQKTSSVNPEQWSWFDNWVTIPSEEFSRLTLAGTDSSRFYQHSNGVALDLQQTERLFMNIPGIGPVIMKRITPQNWHVVPTADNQGFATFPSGTVHDTVSVGMNVHTKGKNDISLELFPEAYPLKEEYRFYVNRPAQLSNTTNLSFYKYDRDDADWEFIPTTFDHNYIVGQAESLGRFALKEDITPPTLTDAQLSQRPDGQWLVMVSATDNLSGLDYDRAEISVNGRQGIAEYEPEDRRLVYYHPNFSPSYPLSVSVTAYDKSGNKQHRVFRIEAPSTKK